MSDNVSTPQTDQVEYLNPVVPDLQIAEQDLRKVSEQLHTLLSVPDIELVTESDFFAWLVLPGETIARVLGEGEGPEAGANVHCESGQYVALACGYLSLCDNTLSVVSPIWTDDEFVKAYWLLLHKDIRSLSTELVQKTIADLGIKKGLVEAAPGLVALWMSEEGSNFKKSLVAEGTAPEHGADAHFEVLVETLEQMGVEQEDGAVDFSAIEPEFCIKSETVIGRLNLAKAGVSDGEDLKGDVVPAQKGKDFGVEAGAGVSINKLSESVWEYVAEKKGVIKFDGQALSMVDLFMIEGDVGYQTGNIDFDGDVFVRGSVSSRFSVKANGNIIIAGSVRPAATVMAQGNVVVGLGVLGEKTRLMAVGNVQAQFVQGANVQSGKRIFLTSHAYKAFLRAGNLVRVHKTEGPRGGSVIGGETWCSSDLDVPIAGALNKVHTRLHVGISPAQVERLEEIQKKLEAGNKVIKQCLIKFRLKQVDLDKVKAILAAATGPQKAMLAVVAKQLGEVMQSYRTLLKERLTVTQSLGKGTEKAGVTIREKAFPGVVIQIGSLHHEVSSEIKARVFRVQGDQMVSE